MLVLLVDGQPLLEVLLLLIVMARLLLLARVRKALGAAAGAGGTQTVRVHPAV